MSRKEPNPPPPEDAVRPDPPPAPPAKVRSCQEVQIFSTEKEARDAFSLIICPKESTESRRYVRLCQAQPPDICAVCLKLKFGYWGEYPDFPVSSWIDEVIDGGTRHSYWEWVSHQMELEEHDEL